jgi:hypothetical protein
MFQVIARECLSRTDSGLQHLQSRIVLSSLFGSASWAVSRFCGPRYGQSSEGCCDDLSRGFVHAGLCSGHRACRTFHHQK